MVNKDWYCLEFLRVDCIILLFSDGRNACITGNMLTPPKATASSHVRKRQPNRSPQIQDCPPLKRQNLIGSYNPALGHDSTENTQNSLAISENQNDTSLVKEDNPYMIQGKKPSPDTNKTVPWIKVEPADEFSQNFANGESIDSPDKMDSPEIQNTTSEMDDIDKNQSKNRRKSLIPLANISKKFGNPSNKIKAEMLDKPNSILRNLYENSPVYRVNDLYAANSDSEMMEKVPVSLPSNLAENLANDNFSGTTENLVLSGYYDSDVYPSYRHRQKHLLNRTASDKKVTKEKSKEKMTPTSPASIVASENPVLKTYESGGRLVYSCDVCKRELSHLTSYRRHMKLHTMERPHVCPICHKGFIRKYHCIDHLNKHHKGIRFDPESLKPLDMSVIDIEDQSAYSPGDLNASEYNYTLDQSLAGSEVDLSLNESIDQSASTMLSELAKSAAKLSQSESEKTSVYQSSVLFGNLDESKENYKQSEEVVSEKNQSDTPVADENRKAEKSGRKGMPSALEKIVAELRSAPKSKHKKESDQKNLPDQDKSMEKVPEHLQNHMDEHKSDEILQTSQCPQGFVAKEIYEEHLVTEHGGEGNNSSDA